MDYLYGLVSGVGENLRIAAVHLADLKEGRREARIDAHTAGVLRAVGSILDNLAGVVVAVGGFDTELMKADLRLLQPLSDGPSYPGPDVRRQLRLTEAALDHADKQGNLLRATRRVIHEH